MKKIPQQLQNSNFGFVKLKKNTKEPFEKDWQNKPYTYLEIQTWIEQGGNYGVLGGYGGLIVIDSDTPEIHEKVKKNLPQTLTVRTPRPGYHSYLLCEGIDSKIILEKDPNVKKDPEKKKNDHLGEITRQRFASGWRWFNSPGNGNRIPSL